jgi:hypothetical protein
VTVRSDSGRGGQSAKLSGCAQPSRKPLDKGRVILIGEPPNVARPSQEPEFQPKAEHGGVALERAEAQHASVLMASDRRCREVCARRDIDLAPVASQPHHPQQATKPKGVHPAMLVMHGYPVLTVRLSLTG